MYTVIISGGVAMPRLAFVDRMVDIPQAEQFVRMCAEALGRQYWRAAVYDNTGAHVCGWTIEHEVKLT